MIFSAQVSSGKGSRRERVRGDVILMVLNALRNDDAGRARAAADRAMRAAGIEVRPAESSADVRRVREVLDQVFRPAPGESEASLELLLALAHTHQYLVLAHDLTVADNCVLAASLGFFCAPDRFTLHSHATAVLAAGRGRHVGWALKLHQRAWAMAAGITTITWTFDPLIRRNAWFNLAKLGARPTAFEIDFYGAIDDGINGGDETDRFILGWQLSAPHVVDACDGASLVSPVAGMLADGVARPLQVGVQEVPVRTELPRDAVCALIQVPADIESIRPVNPMLALRWRRELRAVLTEATERGLDVVAVGRDGWYVLGPKASPGRVP